MANAATLGASSSRPSINSDNTTTAGLLSWAKDIRYLQELQSLLLQSAIPLRLPLDVAQGTWYASFVLYVIFIFIPEGRTLGMKSSGVALVKSGKPRQRILNAATLLAAAGGFWALDRWSNTKSQDTGEDSDNLRGSQRLQHHEALRRQMLRRAQTNFIAPSVSVPTQTSQGGDAGASCRTTAVKLVQKSIMHLHEALFKTFSREGPHMVPSSVDTRSSIRPRTTWVNLHLVHYLFTGRFPTLYHHLIGLRQQLDGSSERMVRVEPNTHRLIAVLIAIQESSWLVRLILRRFTTAVAGYIESRPKQQASSTVDHDRQPACSLTTCSICLGDRVHPAVSSKCGHVFCWNCLRQWVSTANEACPYCRVPCTVEDILPLYSYG